MTIIPNELACGKGKKDLKSCRAGRSEMHRGQSRRASHQRIREDSGGCESQWASKVEDYQADGDYKEGIPCRVTKLDLFV